MSDLISRKSVIEKLEKVLLNDDLTIGEQGLLSDIVAYIMTEPTAYDTGKVVEELEEYLKSERNFNDIIDTGSEIKNPVVTRTLGRIEAFEKSIEIVKQGDVSDDSCEWKIDGVYLRSPHNQPFVTCIADDEDYRYNYCPVCGKKIKAVE